MPTEKDGTYFDVYVGIIAIQFLKVLSEAIEEGHLEELSKLDALGEYFLQDLERVMAQRFQGMNFLDKNIAKAEYESVYQATEMFHFPLTLENLSKLRGICYKTADSHKIEPEDYNFLKSFLECIQKFSYFIVPAVKLSRPAKSG